MIRFSYFWQCFLAAAAGFVMASQGADSQVGRFSTKANRLTYLEEQDPFHVGVHFPRLTTPQWVGEEGVELVVTFGIDDMSGHEPYEKFLRPIINRLKEVDGRAPISIFSNSPNPAEPHLQTWLKEGLSIEAHTLSHPCPILGQRNFAAAGKTYHDCIDLLHKIPGGGPVAFRTPCCDSINSASPRLFAELMCGKSAAGNFVSMDSSVVMLLTTNDPALPAAELIDGEGRPRFQKYVPFPSFKTTIENYPFPYVVNNRIWEMPFPAPSDWEAQNILGNKSAGLTEDWKKAMDLILLKQGTMNLVLHPHGWSGAEQFIALIDQAESRHKGKVKFLTFKEAHERLVKNLLAGQPLRSVSGGDNGVRVLDLNNDGFLDVVIGNSKLRRTRVWNPAENGWDESDFPVTMVNGNDEADPGIRFGVIRPSGAVSLMIANGKERGAWTFDGAGWISDSELLAGLDEDEVLFSVDGRDAGARLRDVDADGVAELMISNPKKNLVFKWNGEVKRWSAGEFVLPEGVSIVNEKGEDNGVRFVDFNQDGFDDVLYSNEGRYGLWLHVPEPFLGFGRGWTRKVTEGKRSDPQAIPAVVRAGANRNNGAWFHSKHLWVQNEDTAHMPDLVDRRSFDELLVGVMPAPKSPEESRKAIRVAPGFEVELVVAEPLVQDPVAFDWDAKGQLWVVEMRDYPMGIDGKEKPGGVVKLLRDGDRDGRYDTATEFLSGLNYPTGVMPWRGGVLVSAAPEILYAEDRDGDGVADVKRVLVTGFGEGNQQHRFNGFVLGLDGWVYGANGDSGGTLQVVGAVLKGELHAKDRVELRSGDFRFKPDTGELEVIEGTTQFGRHRDDWGNWFGNANHTWLWQYHFPAHYLRRNPFLAVREMKTTLANYPEAGRVYPISREMQRPNAVGAQGHVTSANSAVPYRDTLFGPEFGSTFFVSEPSENLVHREVLYRDGAAMFRSRRAEGEERSEFIASTDNYFRPAQTETGPDGALYIADMYRGTIEHPEWIPEDIRSRMDLRAGEEMGRIYRVFPAGKKLRSVPALEQLTNEELGAALESENGWQRDTAMRLLVERKAREVVPQLKRLAQDSRDPKVKIQVLATVDLLGEVPVDLLRVALSDAHPAVRRHGVRLSEELLRRGDGESGIHQLILKQVDDPDAALALQVGLSLGEWGDRRAAAGLVRIAQRHAGDEVIQNAVLSSAVPHYPEMLSIVAADPAVEKTSPVLIENLFRLALESKNKEAVLSSLKLTSRLGGEKSAGIQFRAAASLMGFLREGPVSPAEREKVAGELRPIFQRAREIAFSKRPDQERVAALRALVIEEGESEGMVRKKAKLLEPMEPLSIQRGALELFKRSGNPHVGPVLLSVWPELGPSMRSAVLDIFSSDAGRTAMLLEALERGVIEREDFNPTARQQLLQHGRAEVRERAGKVFAAIRLDREALLHEYEPVRELAGDVERGRREFSHNCASCHRLQGVGFAVGPDLATMGDQSASALLAAILDPNRTVVEQYLNYQARTVDGREVSGMIASETPNSITLKSANGVEEVLLRGSLAEVKSTERSLMPEGFEHSLDLQQMADLIAFISNSAAPSKTFAGNEPRVVRPSENGVILLEAAAAEIYGPSLVFENAYKNLGYWQSENDRAVWNFEVEKLGDYAVVVLGAFPGQDHKNTLRLDVGESVLEGRIASTGAWEIYRKQKWGTVRLSAGLHRLVARGTPPVEEAILDLRSISLVPAGTAD